MNREHTLKGLWLVFKLCVIVVLVLWANGLFYSPG